MVEKHNITNEALGFSVFTSLEIKDLEIHH